jgi:oligopeptide transport system substrate-binding protein
MRKTRKAAAVLTAVAMAAVSAVPAMADEIKDLYQYETQAREIETWNILYSQNAADLNVLTNLYDGLLEADEYGQLTPAIAESWETEDDGVTWTFHLRKGVKWVDQNGNEKGEVTAQDFLTGLEWVLNFHKNDATNTSMPMEMIVGAEDYYNMTSELDSEAGLALNAESSEFADTVGIKAIDDYTLQYTCVSEKPYFDTVATYNCLYPVSQAMIDEIGIDGFKAATPENIWYNGCYTCTEYIQQNTKTLTKNPLYWDTDAKLFDTVTIKMVESLDTAYQLYTTGELDSVSLSESNLTTISSNESNEYYNQLVEMRPTKFSYQFHFNYDKHNADQTKDDNWNTAIANEAFRKCWYYGLDLGSWYKRTNAINPYKCYNNSYTMQGLIYTSDGTEYTQLVQEKLGLPTTYDGESMSRLDSDKFEEYKAQAIEELTAAGVTFPVHAAYYIASGNQTALDSANVLKQAFSDSFGDDFIVLDIETYVSSLAQEVRNPRLQSFVINGWGADYGDPQNYLGQETNDSDNAYYMVAYSHGVDNESEELNALYTEFTELVNKADAITDDLDARYEAYAEAEAFMLEHALTVPAYFDVEWELTHINDYSKINAMFGMQNNKYKNWETSTDAYTAEDYAAFKEAWEAGSAE